MKSRFAAFVRFRHATPPLVMLVVCAAAAVLVPATPARAGSPDSARALRALLGFQQAKLTASDGATGDYFGHSVAISGDTAVVSACGDKVGTHAFQGSAYIFVRSGSAWSKQAKLTAADGAANDYFGTSVAISGETVVVGAPDDNVGANEDQGSAYVFVRSGITWSQQTKLTAADGAYSDNFGSSAAIEGDTAVVGADNDSVGAGFRQGSTYVFVRSATAWSQQQRLTATDGLEGDQFGYTVAVSGETVVVGAPSDDAGVWVGSDEGSAYVFVRSGTAWSQQRKLTAAADAEAGDGFGESVAVSGETAVVGALGDNIGDDVVGLKVNQGSAYVFVRSGTAWSRQAQLVAADGATGDWFGSSVAVGGDTAVVGAVDDNIGANPDQGSACVFVRSGTAWSQQAKLTAADGAAGDWFGCSVAISGDTAVVGACYDKVGSDRNQGSACVFLPAEIAKPAKPVAKSPKGLISSRTPTFKWTAAGGADVYEVRVYKGSSLIRKKTGITTTSWRCTKRLPRGVYLTWKVQARNAAGAGPWSAKPRFKVR